MEAVALFDYEGEDPATDLSFQEGDLITNIKDTQSDNWKTGSCGGRSGLFPANFVEFRDSPAVPSGKPGAAAASAAVAAAVGGADPEESRRRDEERRKKREEEKRVAETERKKEEIARKKADLRRQQEELAAQQAAIDAEAARIHAIEQEKERKRRAEEERKRREAEEAERRRIEEERRQRRLEEERRKALEKARKAEEKRLKDEKKALGKERQRIEREERDIEDLKQRIEAMKRDVEKRTRQVAIDQTEIVEREGRYRDAVSRFEEMGATLANGGPIPENMMGGGGGGGSGGSGGNGGGRPAGRGRGSEPPIPVMNGGGAGKGKKKDKGKNKKKDKGRNESADMAAASAALNVKTLGEPPSNMGRPATGRTAKALYDCVPEKDDELEFRAGDIVTNIEPTDNPNWSKGCVRGQTGFFPVNYVEFMQPVAPRVGNAPAAAGPEAGRTRNKRGNTGASAPPTPAEDDGSAPVVKPVEGPPPREMPIRPPAKALKDRANYYGFLEKAGPKGTGWKRRFFVLADYVLYYYKTPNDKEPLGTFPIVSYNVIRHKKRDFAFLIEKDNCRTYHLAAENQTEMEKWMDVLKQASRMQTITLDDFDLSNPPPEPETYDNDSDSDDMLGGPPRPNAVATAEGIMAAPGDVSDEWSDDGGTTSTAPTGGPAKPFGAVALFGQGGVPKLPAVKARPKVREREPEIPTPGEGMQYRRPLDGPKVNAVKPPKLKGGPKVPTAKRPTAKKPSKKKPSGKKPAAKKPTAKKPSAKKPSGKRKPKGKAANWKKPG